MDVKVYEDIRQRDLIDISLNVGILDGVYPVLLTGKSGWLTRIDNERLNMNEGGERIRAEKIQRNDSLYETRFDLYLYGESISFVLPIIIAKHLKNRIDSSQSGERIFEIDVPFIDERERRRFYKIEIELPHNEREKYLRKLNSVQSY